jgi:hypothetical protein
MRGFLAKLVAPEPRDRFATAAQASDALERAAKGERMISPKTAARTWTRPLILAAASLVFVAGGGALGYHHADDRNEAITKEVASQEDIILQGTMQMSLLSFQMCGCETKVCAEDTSEQWVTWSTELAKRERLLHDAKTLVIRGKAAERYAKCYSKHLAAQLPPEHRIPPGDPIDLAFANASLHDVLRTVGERCNASVVIPAHIESKLTINVAKVPCDQALEVLLESRGLWYEYVPEGRLLRIAERKDLDRARVEAIERAKLGGVDVPLPAGGTIDLDLKGAPLHDVIQMLAASAKLNIIVPDHIGGNVTVRLVKAPWDVAFRAILAAHGLGYTYRENGKLVRVAERNELLRELVEERERQKLR